MAKLETKLKMTSGWSDWITNCGTRSDM